MNYEQFSFLIVAGLPDSTEFGIDLLGISVTDEFRGVKLIPPGLHFIYSSCKDVQLNFAPRCGFMHYFSQGEIVVREWNPETEELQERVKGDTELEKQRIRENLKHLDKYLALYDYEKFNKWKSLTNLISEEAVKRLNPDCGVIRHSEEFLPCTDQDRPRGTSLTPIRNIKIKTNEDEEMYLPAMQVISGTQPNYIKLPEKFNKSMAPSEITYNNIDTINLVERLFNELSTESQLLEELQHSFIVYLCSLNIDALAHWRKILSLLSNSDIAVGKYRNFYKSFVTVIKFQIPEIPIEFIEQSSTNTIYIDMQSLLRNLSSNNCLDLCSNLRVHLDREIGWTFNENLDDDEDPENLPVVVEL